MHANQTARETRSTENRAPQRTPVAAGAGLPGVTSLQRSAGNAAATRALRQHSGHPAVQRAKQQPGSQKQDAPAALVQPHYASGDQFAIAAMLMHDKSRLVYITTDDSDESSKKAGKIKDFYLESGVESNRVKVTKKGSAETEYKADFPGRNFPARTSSKDKMIPVGGGTTYVGENFSDDMRATVREGWGLHGDQKQGNDGDHHIEEWLRKKNVDVGGKKVAVLWSRFSGKNGEVHLEHDTSYTGMAQIINGLKGIDIALIVGDAKPKTRSNHSSEKNKFANIGARAPKFNGSVVDLTNFWDDGEYQKLVGGGRKNQFLVFDYLNRHTKTSRHLGFRSGNLEAMALMGFSVMYMEEPDSWQGGSRMEAWHDQGAGKTSLGGDAPGYERLRVSKPPTISGQFQKSLDSDSQKKNKHGEWYQNRKDPGHEGTPGSMPKSDGDLAKSAQAVDVPAESLNKADFTRGFAAEDLENIHSYLEHGNPEKDLDATLVEEVKAIREAIDSEDAKAKAIDTEAKSAANAAKLAIKTKKDQVKKEHKKANKGNSEDSTSVSALNEMVAASTADMPTPEQAAEIVQRKRAGDRERIAANIAKHQETFRGLAKKHDPVQVRRARNIFAPNLAHRLRLDT
ncbi:hypothetical protein ACFQ8O_29075 [Streptomyces coelicoflavus]|uniref:hypothetical protein n=1 Tax=Streptomyces coelicoflavus TaxID=285562 RepID=UPI00368229FD